MPESTTSWTVFWISNKAGYDMIVSGSWIVIFVGVLLSFAAIILYLYHRDKKRSAEHAEKMADLDQRSSVLLEKEFAFLKKEDELWHRERRINEQVRKRFTETVADIAQRDYLVRTPAFRAVRNEPDEKRLLSSLTQAMYLAYPFDISSNIETEDEHCYRVTLYSCTCPDYEHRKRPCKHMYRLAVEVGGLIGFDVSSVEKRVKTLLTESQSLQADAQKAKAQIQKLEDLKSDVLHILSDSSQSSPWLAHLYAEYFDLQEKQMEDALRNRPRPALKAADDVKRIRQENRQLRAQAKANEYQLNFYESLFPWLVDFREITPEDAYAALIETNSDSGSEYESLRKWLSPEEYAHLSTQEKYQLALDRYQTRSKSNWDVGIEYERYIGYCCEARGYKVSYSGAKLGLEDMGRDLIATKETSCFVVQCKRWAKEKRIHEKHIFQLFGSCVLYEAQHPGVHVSGVFVTTTELSDIARDCAGRLGIQLFENIPFAKYPLIKCNISRSGEKIYHLPFDQQYDRVVIDPHSGEFFAETVLEAESAGFRRAFRHTSHQ